MSGLMRDIPEPELNRSSSDGEIARASHWKGVISGFGGSVRRTMNPAFLNEVANHPGVRPWLGGDGEIDLSNAIANPDNIALQGDGGGFLLIKKDAGVYEAHSLFLPEKRANSVNAMRDGFAYLFLETDAFRIITQVPDENRAAIAFAKRACLTPWFRCEHTGMGPSQFYMIELDGWVQSSPFLEAYGEWFHDKLLEAKRSAGSGLPVHLHEPSHERAVGAALAMILRGNVDKGVSTYNRWASASGYARVSLVSRSPLVVDVVDAMVTMAGQDMEVLLCR